MTFSTFTIWYNHHRCLVPNHSHHPMKNPCADIQELCPISTPPPAPHSACNTHLPSSLNLPVLDILYKCNHTVMRSFLRLTSVITFSRFFHVIACVSTLFFFIAEYSIV